jgi:hypothetical protein
MAGWIWAMPLVAQGVNQGLAQLGLWIGWIQ